MIKFLKKLFGPKKLPIDQLLELTGRDYFYFWNGMNYSSESNFTKDEDLPQHGTLYYKCNGSLCAPAKDYPPFFKIGFGRFVSGIGDWGYGAERTQEPIIEMFINLKDFTIRKIHRNTGYNCGPGAGRNKGSCTLTKKGFKCLEKILKQIHEGDVFQTSDAKINELFKTYAETPDPFKYSWVISGYGSNFDHIFWQIGESIKAYKKDHPKYDLWIDEDYLKSNNISFPKTRFDTWDEAYKRENELADGALKIPHEFIYIDCVENW